MITKLSVLIPSSIFFAEAGMNKSNAFRGFFKAYKCTSVIMQKTKWDNRLIVSVSTWLI